MGRFRLFSFLIFLLVVAGCGKPLPELSGFDKEAWIKDPNGCLSKRIGMLKVIQSEKDKLLALDEMKVVALLGKPDSNQLHKRNQKFFHYFLDPSPSCSEAPTTGRKLVVRFNAMGLANEVYIE